jgi:hypothetical protein
MRKKWFQLFPLKYSTDVRWRLSCRDVLELWVMPQLLQDRPNVVFQRDGAPPHIHNDVRSFLNRHLPKRWIGRGGGGSTSWPLRSPDLTSLDFSQWGFVTNEVYAPPVPITPKNLKDRMQTAVAKSDQPLLQNVWHEVEYRLVFARQQTQYILNLA